MEFLQLIHGYVFPTPLARPFPTPYALATLVLLIWSIGPAIKTRVGKPFMVWLRLTWVAFLLPGVTGVLLALGGLKVPSATDVGGGVTRYGYAADPSRDYEHWMYTGLALVSLYIIEILVKGNVIQHQKGLRYLPLATLFLYACAVRVGQVAFFPGSTPGT